MPRKTLSSDIKNSVNSYIGKKINDNIHIQGMCTHTSMIDLKGCDIENSKFVINECACPLIYSNNPEECNQADAKCGPTDFFNKIDDKQKSQQQQELVSSISQKTGIKFLPGSYTAKNIANASLNAINNINNTLYQGCTNQQNSMNTIYCRNSELDNVYISQQNNSLGDVVDCVTSSEHYDSAVQDLTSTISQMEKVSHPSLLNYMNGVLLTFAVIGLIFILMSGFPFIFVQIPLILTLTIIVIYLYYWIDKKYGKDTKTVASYCQDCSIHDSKEDCNKALCYWDENSGTCLCDGTKLDCTTQCPNYRTKTSCIKNNCGWNPVERKCTGNNNYCTIPS